MSLWRQRQAIARAVAGELGPEDEAKLRVHLGGCNECRRYYDALSVQARILAGDPHASAVQSEREMARLMAALNPAAAVPAVEAPSWWPRFAMAAGVAAAVLFGFFSWQQAAVEPVDQIAWRGDSTADAGPLFELWVVTAPRDGGELRRDIAFPSDAQGRVGTNAWVAFAKKGSVELSRVVLVNEKGETLVLKPGQSVALDPGKWRAFGVASELDDQALSAAAREAGVEGRSLKLPGPQVTGALIVEL
jgi:hypothetical protein